MNLFFIVVLNVVTFIFGVVFFPVLGFIYLHYWACKFYYINVFAKLERVSIFLCVLSFFFFFIVVMVGFSAAEAARNDLLVVLWPVVLLGDYFLRVYAALGVILASIALLVLNNQQSS